MTTTSIIAGDVLGTSDRSYGFAVIIDSTSINTRVTAYTYTKADAGMTNRAELVLATGTDIYEAATAGLFACGFNEHAADMSISGVAGFDAEAIA